MFCTCGSVRWTSDDLLFAAFVHRFVVVLCSAAESLRPRPMVAVSLHAALVLTGGGLKEPEILSTREVDGRQFVRLSRSDSTLTRFLVGRRAGLHPLKDSSLFQELVAMRNSVSKTSCDEEPVEDSKDHIDDDLGLDSVPEKQKSDVGYSKIPIHTVQIVLENKHVNVLSGFGLRDVCMEATSGNMDMLYRMVSTELQKAKPVSTESAVTEPESALPQPASDSSEAPRTPSHSRFILGMDVETPSKQLHSLMESDEPEVCSSRARGCTWIANRRAWVVRYKDEDGVKRQKRFHAQDHTSDSSRLDAEEVALSWLAEHFEAIRALSNS